MVVSPFSRHLSDTGSRSERGLYEFNEGATTSDTESSIMHWRSLILSLGLLWSGCAASGPRHTDLQTPGHACIKAAETWLNQPGDKKKLKHALQTLKETNEAIKKAGGSSEQAAIITDLDTLQGALNMAQMQVDDGRDPTGPSELGESSGTNAVTVAVEQLRTDLNRQVSSPATP